MPYKRWKGSGNKHFPALSSNQERYLEEKCKYICKCLPPLLEKQLIWAFRICGGRLEENK
jgi:hypothetical protein